MTSVCPVPWSLDGGEAWAWLRNRPEGGADALITDPPYSSGGLHFGDRTKDPASKYSAAETPSPTFTGDNRDQRAFGRWLALWLTDAHRAIREGGVAVVASDWRQLPTVTDAIQIAGFTWRGIVTWTKKGGSRPQPGRYRNDSEFFVWGSKGAFRGRGSPLPGTLEDAGVGELEAPSVACSPVGSRARLHLTEKPVAVMRELVKIVPPGSLVLDPFAGAASTGIACLEEGRRFAGCELSPTYLEIGRRRLEGWRR